MGGVLVAVGLVVGACGDDPDRGADDGAAGASSTAVAAGPSGVEPDVPYAEADVDGWLVAEHIDPDAGAAPSLPGDPAMDWYSSYERSVTTGDVTSVSTVRVSGHALAMTALAEQLPGRTFEPASVGRFEALAGVPPAATEPAIALLDVDGRSAVMVLSYELSLDELLAWSEHVRLVSDEEWSAVPSQG